MGNKEKINKGLKYFKEVYEEVPKWVSVMNDYNSNMLDYYTDIRGEAFGTGYITAAEKDALTAAVNAGRSYERSMMYHTFGAIKKEIDPIELSEYIIATYLYKGLESLKFGLKSIKYSFELKEKKVDYNVNKLENLFDVIKLIITWFAEEENNYFKKLLEVAESGNEELIREKILQNGKISYKQKYLTIIGCFVTELNGEGAEDWIEEAREKGVSDSEMADLGYVCILTAGIPSWFELSDSLKAKE